MGHCKLACIAVFFVAATASWGQSSDSAGAAAPVASPTPVSQPSATPAADDDSREASDNPVKFLRNLGRDQKDIWTSPFRARIQDLNWILPLTGLSVGLIDADAEMSSRIAGTSTLGRHASTLSNAGLGLALGGSGGLYLLGKVRHDDRQKETGILAIEAATDSLIVGEVFKVATQRARPNDGNGRGDFLNSSSITNSSFPSVHALLTWSAASVLVHEYPGPLTQIFAYGLATGVSIARVAGRDHFPSDVVVGSAVGWLIGHQVYKSHHDIELPNDRYGTFVREPKIEGEPTAERASPYVPIDSWVYAAFDRLAAMGYISSDIVGLRPWTRKECSRLVEEVSGDVDETNPDEAWRLYSALAREFATELDGKETDSIALDSVYARVTSISGPPLTDGYHFGQTIVNNYGRPYERGTNAQVGFTSSGSAGALGFFVQGEQEHAPSAPGFSQAVQDAIQAADLKGPQAAAPVAAFNQFRLLDAYLSLNIAGWQTSFGKQTLWLGPTQDPFLWSNNAEPIYMLRVDQTHPQKLPGFLGIFGLVKTEFWVGKLTGSHWINTQDAAVGVVSSIGRTLSKQPMVNGLKVNFKPTRNFEFGVGRTGMFGGPDFPITLGTLKHSLFSTTNAAGRDHDPGDRRSTFDFTYRLPGFRKLLTLYDDSFVEDEISPIGYPRRAAHSPGLYLSQVPGIEHLDMRVEASYTNLPNLIQFPDTGGFFYWNTRYLDGYTNKGNIVGNGTVGRQGIALRADTAYWVASDKKLQFGYRNEIADNEFLQGGNLRDIHFKSEWSFSPRVSLSSLLQYEWWNFPLLTAGKKQNDFTASFQLTYWPHWKLKRS